MKQLLPLLVLLGMLITSCSDKSSDSSAQPEKFSGITYTDINGNINGTNDADDWRLIAGKPPYKRFATSDLSGEIPDSFAAKPAYPNPTDGLITVTFAFPVAVNYEVRVIDKYRHTLANYEGSNEAGFLTINWAPVDSLGRKLSPDIYRVVYNFYGIWGYGDIKVVE